MSDEAARRLAVDPERSVILQAPAGSGKTSVLIERLLVLLARVDSPEEILAITFTRKAAAEMALRVAQILEQAAEPDASEVRAHHLWRLAQAVRERSRARGWHLAEHPGRLRIQTLDSLNRALAVQMPLAARAAGSLTVLPQARAAYTSAARRTLLDAQSDPALRPDAQLLFERMENDFGRCESLIAGMLEKRTHWLPYLVGEAAQQLVARLRESLEAVVQARLTEAQALLPAALLDEALALGAATARHLDMRNAVAGAWAEFLATPQPSPPTLRHWQALAAIGLTAEGTWRKRLDVRMGFPPDDAALKRRGTDWIAALAAQPGALELLVDIQLLPDPQLSEDETGMLEALARLLRLAVAELDLVFGELGRVDYPAIAAAAAAALGSVDEPTDLALRLDSHVRHILVDEFQDTSFEQTRLLTLLTAGWTPGDGRTLFLVGDPMQSIYGFREAEVGMFLEARRSGIGAIPLESLSLQRNFRSTPEVVAWNNRVFAASFPALDDPRSSSVAYATSLAARAASAPGRVQLHRVLPGDARGEASRIAATVTQLRASEPESSIAILVSSRAHAGPIVAALEAQAVPVAGVDLVSLAMLSIVRDLTALTLALDHLGDRTAWLALLRAPWCGLPLGEISQLVGDDRRATVWERLGDPQRLALLPKDSQARLSRLREALAPQPDPQGLARRVEACWLALGGPAACADDNDLQHARAFFDALSKWSQEPDWTGPQELPRRLDRLFAAHGAVAANAVQIMTIHHAKGLEFDHVILPGLGRRRRGNSTQLLQWLDLPRGSEGSDLLMVAVPPVAAREPTALGRYVSELQKQRQRNEATRLLYVAATRARHQLHLFGQLDAAVEGRPAPRPGSGTLLERLWAEIREEFPPEAAALAASESPAEEGTSVAMLERLSARWSLPAPPPAPQPVMLPVATYEAPQTNEDDAAPVDRAVCEVLRSLARRGRLPEQDDPGLLQQLRTRLQRLGVVSDALEAAVIAGVTQLQGAFEDSRLQWMFTNLSRPDGGAEAPLSLTGMFEGRLVSSRADLSFLDPAGTRWLIDIAPPVDDSAAALEAAFARRVLRHAHLAAALAEGPARAAVYLPATRLFWTGP